MLHFGLNKPHQNLTNADIEGSKPDIVKFKSTRPPSNPLNPVYKLQHVEYVPPSPPKFVRDGMSIADLEGAQPKKAPERVQRDPLKVNDITGASAKQAYVRAKHYDSIGYNDVYAKDWASKRVTNPLDPNYAVRDGIAAGEFIKMEGATLNDQYGAIDKSKPSTLPPAVSGVRNLDTKDIGGAQANTKNVGAFGHYQRRE